MNITFKALAESDLELLLRWLETPHIKVWWDSDMVWNKAKVYEKYGSYIKGYKIEDGQVKPLDAYIIYLDARPVGYLQAYNAYDFKRSIPLTDLPKSLAAFDLFLGEEDIRGKGIGPMALKTFFLTWDKKFDYAFADPDQRNTAAVRAYEKAGFEKIKELPESHELWMLKKL
jgi:aminoglycoside 6'-N-acetyltransferase